MPSTSKAKQDETFNANTHSQGRNIPIVQRSCTIAQLYKKTFLYAFSLRTFSNYSHFSLPPSFSGRTLKLLSIATMQRIILATAALVLGTAQAKVYVFKADGACI